MGTSPGDDILERIVASQQREQLEQALRAQSRDPTDAEFALTAHSAQLRVDGTEGEPNPKLRPLVVALVLPQPPLRALWAASDPSLFNWLSATDVTYEP